MIFVSTGGESQIPASHTSRYWRKFGLENIELSGGAVFDDQLKELVRLKRSQNFQIHNYFPPPIKPFVFNLASLNPDIVALSYQHVQQAMQWALELDRPIYSFHSGFLIDPDFSELGKRVVNRPLFDREESIRRFIDRVNHLAEYAKTLGVMLLIENNVLSANNYNIFGNNPFLMADAAECLRVMENTPGNVGLLIDVAHLKVTSISLSFDPVKFLNECGKWTRAYHLSDNDGLRDSNQPFTIESWFWPYLRRDLNYYSIEVYGVQPKVLLEQSILTRNLLGFENGNA